MCSSDHALVAEEKDGSKHVRDVAGRRIDKHLIRRMLLDRQHNFLLFHIVSPLQSDHTRCFET